MIGARELAEALGRLGVRRDGALFVHSRLANQSRVEGETPAAKMDTLIAGLQRAVADGTLILPTFTYSFTSGRDFDIARSRSAVGMLSEHFRRRRDVRRTADPMFSCAIWGRVPRDREAPLFAPGPKECFGPDSAFGLLHDEGGSLLFLDVGIEACTFIHFVERRAGVGYRYDKRLTGRVIAGETTIETHADFFARDLERGVETDLSALGAALERSGALRAADLPGGLRLQVVAARELEAEAVRGLEQRADFLLAR